jgi:hypothetical protein
MCERVNFSDWEGRENIGGTLFGSCRPEDSLSLTAAGLPGIYVQPDTGEYEQISSPDAYKKKSKNLKETV